MKARREHRVPMASRALAVLLEAHELTGGQGLVFPGETLRQRPALGYVLHDAAPPLRGGGRPSRIPLVLPGLDGGADFGKLGHRGERPCPHDQRAGPASAITGRTTSRSGGR